MTTLRKFSFLLKIFLITMTFTSLAEGQVSSTYLTQNARTIEDLRYVLGENYKFLVAAYWRYMITSCELATLKMAADLRATYLYKFCMFINPCPDIYITQSCLVQYTALYIRTACCPVLPFSPETTMAPVSSCVYGNVMLNSKIYGGVQANVAEFPWVAMLLKNGVLLCGSTIIDSIHVLTAAHCFNSYSNDSSYEIFAGRYTFDLKVTDEGQQRVSVKTVQVHEGYNKQSSSKDNDLALITLTSPLTITNYVTPACLPSPSDSLEQFCTVVGWGNTEDQQKPPNVLMKVRLQVYSAAECLNTFQQTSANITTFVSDNSICAANGTYGGLDACKGDSGGPLMCVKQSSDNSYKYLVFGIVSNGNGCALPGEPGVYTKVANYLDWIYNKTQQS